MKKVVFGAVIAALIAGAAFAAYASDFPETLFPQKEATVEAGTGPCPETAHEQERLREATVVVSTYFFDRSGEHIGGGRGLGFLRKEVVVTAAHVIDGRGLKERWASRQLFISSLAKDRGKQFRVPKVAYENNSVDFALLAIPEAFPRPEEALLFPIAQPDDIAYGIPACFFLHPFSGKLDEPIVGTVSRYPPPYSSPAWFGVSIAPTTTNTIPGASGGPVFLRMDEGLITAGIVIRLGGEDEEERTVKVQATDITYAAQDILRKTGIDIK